MNITFSNNISIDHYNHLRQSVDFTPITLKRAKIALSNSLYLCVAELDGKPIGMSRVVGDGGYVFFICDVIVDPKYQSNGIGRKLIERILSLIEADVNEGETIMVNLMSAINKESFYKKLGFCERPFGNHGAGMSKWIKK